MKNKFGVDLELRIANRVFGTNRREADKNNREVQIKQEEILRKVCVNVLLRDKQVAENLHKMLLAKIA